MKIKGAIFDLDGTILDSMFIWQDVDIKLLKNRGIEAKEDIHKELATLSLDDGAELVRTAYNLPDSKEKIIEDIHSIVADFYINEALLKDGAKELLEFLHSNDVKICLATASYRSLAEAALKRNGVLNYFSEIFTCKEIGIGKESPDIFELALKHLATEKEYTWVFEDASHSAKTAKNAGFPVVGIYDRGEAHTNKLKEISDIYVKSILEVKKHFE